jgi:hypothetical protein
MHINNHKGVYRYQSEGRDDNFRLPVIRTRVRKERRGTFNLAVVHAKATAPSWRHERPTRLISKARA